MDVAELMTPEVIAVDSDASLDDAMALMDEHDIRHLVVLRDGHVVGELSERDLFEITGWLPPRVREVLESPSGPVSQFMNSPVVSLSPQDTWITACFRFLEWNIGCLPVLADGALVGMLSESDLLRAYIDACHGDSLAVESDPTADAVMTADVVCAEEATPGDEALAFCREKGLRHLPLVRDGKLCGMVTDRDLRLAVGRGDLEERPCGELGARALVTKGPDARLCEVARTLLEKRIGAVPIVDGERILGLVSTADILGHCVEAFGAKA